MRVTQSNKGSALAISLVILTAITLISISSLQRSGLQARMVGSIQHKEEAFHSTNNELEGVFQYYTQGTNKDDSSSEAATAFSELYKAANSDSKYINNKQVYDPVSVSYDSTDPHSQLTLVSNIRFKNTTMAPGFSSGAFKNHNYDINSSSLEARSLIRASISLGSATILALI